MSIQTLLLYLFACSDAPLVPLCMFRYSSFTHCLFESFFSTSVAVTKLFYLCRISTDASSLQLCLFSRFSYSICLFRFYSNWYICLCPDSPSNPLVVTYATYPCFIITDKCKSKKEVLTLSRRRVALPSLNFGDF